MVDVYCPRCGAVLPMSVFMRQVAKRKYNRQILVNIIRELKKTTTGELARQYQIDSGEPISLRQLGNIIRELEKEGEVQTRLLHQGRFGVTTEITALKKETTRK